MTLSSTISAIACAGLLALTAPMATGCWTAPQPEFEDVPTTLPHADEKPLPPPRDLPGVDTSRLDAKKRGDWWKLVNELYAPCPDQAVTVEQCVSDSRTCAACAPMAQLISDKLQSGLSRADAEAAAAARFGPDVKKVAVRDSPTRGPADAPVTIIVWSDFECPHCAHGVPILEQFQAEHRADVRLVHKMFPLEKHAKARGAAIAAIAALRQGKYWQMEKMIFENQDHLDPSDLKRYAEAVGLDLERYEHDIDDPITEAWVNRDVKDGNEAGLQSTPYILINGRHFDLDYFKYPDLPGWVEFEIAQTKSPKPAIVPPPKPAASSTPPAAPSGE
ncbi:MAG: thioredoxin domain-containing protein [Polyangiaceae bacterium]